MSSLPTAAGLLLFMTGTVVLPSPWEREACWLASSMHGFRFGFSELEVSQHSAGCLPLCLPSLFTWLATHHVNPA